MTIAELKLMAFKNRDIDNMKTKDGFLPQWIPAKDGGWENSFSLNYSKGMYGIAFNQANYTGFWRKTPYFQSRDLQAIVDWYNEKIDSQ